MTQDPPAVSVVVPNLDSPWIGKTLTALVGEIAHFSQDGSQDLAAEVVVIGRDAPGEIPKFLDAHPESASTVRFVDTGEPLSPSAARNRGVAEARGRLLLFTDADCTPRPGWLDYLVAALQVSPVAGGAVTFDTEAGYWAVADNIASFHELLPDRPDEPDTRDPLGSLNLAVTRDAWETAGPFDEELVTSEDLDWVLRARGAGLATAFVPDAVIEHAPVRADRAALEDHAHWYGEHFHEFRRRHPGIFDRGPTWKSPRRLALAAPLKSWVSALGIFQRHRWLPWKYLPGVAAFKRAWYRAVVAGWERG